MSNTPRTDSSVVETDWLGTRVELVNADFARKLERENAALRAALMECRSAAVMLKRDMDSAYGDVVFLQCKKETWIAFSERVDKATAIDAARKEEQP